MSKVSLHPNRAIDPRAALAFILQSLFCPPLGKDKNGNDVYCEYQVADAISIMKQFRTQVPDDRVEAAAQAIWVEVHNYAPARPGEICLRDEWPNVRGRMREMYVAAARAALSAALQTG